MNKLNRLRKLAAGIWRYNLGLKFSTLLPREIIINLTYQCNSKCIMCNIWQTKPEKIMGVKEWKKVVKEKFFSEVEAITFSGGEPILHPEFNEIINLFINELPKLKQVSVITNGFFVDRVVKSIEKLAKTCQKKDIDLGVSVSLDGINKKHEEIRRVKDAFNKTQETLKRLKEVRLKYPFNLNIGSIILKQNLKNFNETQKWLEKEKVDYGFQIVGFHENFVNNLETESKINFDKNDKKELIKVLKKLKKNGGPRAYYWQDLIEMYFFKKNRSTPCPFLVDQAAIDGRGNVFYCLSEKPIGNFLKEKREILDIYLDKENLNFRRNLVNSVCKKCNSGCNISWAIVFDFKKFLWFKMTGNTGYGFKKIF